MLKRVRLLRFFFILCFFLILGRLFFLQVVLGENFAKRAKFQYRSVSKLDALRGDILANDKTFLATSINSWLMYADLTKVKDDKANLVQTLVENIEKSEEEKKLLMAEFEELLTKQGLVWVPLAHKIKTQDKEKLERIKVPGIGFEPEEERIYPEASSAAHLVGFVGKNEEGEDVGYFGLEGFYNFLLAGKEGFLSREEDALGSPILLEAFRKVEPREGASLLTHIDKKIQYIIEKKLSDGVKKYKAEGGMVVVMNPTNGAIMGMASYPNFDPNFYWKYNDSLFVNPVISYGFEPGSVFKVIVMAAALDSGKVKDTTICDICNGPVVIGKYTIHTWNDVYHPNSNMVDVIVNSDNVGMVFVVKKLGKENLLSYLKKFGFGEKTGIDLQGEAKSFLKKEEDLSEIDTATIGFGQGILVTPIQLISAVSAIANSGVMMKPQVVDKIIGNGWEKDIEPEVASIPITPQTAEVIKAMMVEAAKRGESKWTHIRGFKVAGKTGTAQIPIEGHYDPEKTMASFVGFAPYDDPKFVMLVTLRKPTTSIWASETAAPLWYSIANDLFLHFGIQPEEK